MPYNEHKPKIWQPLVHVFWKTILTIVMFRHAHDFQLNFFSMYQNCLMYQGNLNVFEKHVVNNNWLQLKNHGKHNLDVDFLYIITIYVSHVENKCW